MPGNLSWQQVSAPSDSAAIYGVRSAADLLSNGFQSAQNAVKNIQDARSQAAQSQFLQNLTQYGSADQVHAAEANGTLYNGVDRSLITPDVISALDKHVSSLTNNAYINQQTQTMAANAAQTALDNQFNNNARTSRQDAAGIIDAALSNPNARAGLDSLSSNPAFQRMSAADQQAAIVSLNNRITGDRDFGLRQQQVNASTALEGAQAAEIRDRQNLARNTAALGVKALSMPDAQSFRDLLNNSGADPRAIASVAAAGQQMFPGAFGQVNNADYPVGAGNPPQQAYAGRGRPSSGSQQPDQGSPGFFANSSFAPQQDQAVNGAINNIQNRVKSSPWTAGFMQAGSSRDTVGDVASNISKQIGGDTGLILGKINEIVNDTGMSAEQAGQVYLSANNGNHWYNFGYSGTGNHTGYSQDKIDNLVQQYNERNKGTNAGKLFQDSLQANINSQSASDQIQSAYQQQQRSILNYRQVQSRVGKSPTGEAADALARAKARYDMSEQFLNQQLKAAGNFSVPASIDASNVPAPYQPPSDFNINGFIDNMQNPNSPDYQRFGVNSR